MEELLAGIFGGAVVYVAGKSDIMRGALKGIIKMGYSVADAVTSGGGETLESLKDIMAESKAEYEAVKAAKAEAAVKA
ncbi:hypothetical protein [Candidatus Magnetominusculus xianensis]|uniref:Uncharacterized protein n=1 Tax=Candidatus Magnetominusculus xianensis TaxID=1748249 RepID=A0ABR5SBY9_9BACT|nr:hypothetical protein [Candidatus Magnetominusculus xianensis]KWT78272.1 hypothetical protein ASN18_2876 [Candidatus Magnetominusculus xianensis]MBF0404040.1 hypothetical protein [Nitrospirota bacterium]